jgi:hypothetical protein
MFSWLNQYWTLSWHGSPSHRHLWREKPHTYATRDEVPVVLDDFENIILDLGVYLVAKGW